MTNLEWVLKNNKADFINAISATYCWGVEKNGTFRITCDGLTCAECKFGNMTIPCSVQKANWLEAEYEEPPLFPIGTPVEVVTKDAIYMGYYNGFENNIHYVTHYKEYVGRRYNDGEIHGARCKAEQLRKVGDSNA